MGEELAEGVGEGADSEPFCGADESVLPVGFAAGAPVVGEKVVAEVAGVAGVSKVALAVGAVRAKGEVNDIVDARAEGALVDGEVARIFLPGGSHGSFDCISGRDAGEAHAVAFGESVPMRAVLGGSIDGGSEGGGEEP